MLCFLPGFDLIDDTKYCPTERNALKEFYDSAKGTEWTENENWLDPHIGHCDWYGVKCNDANSTVILELQSNGLSGTLTPNISTLSSLVVLAGNVGDMAKCRQILPRQANFGDMVFSVSADFCVAVSRH